jgi:predicted nuclease of predicted toxin-antitoxin system
VAERIKLYTHEHVPRAVIRGLRERGVDTLTVSEARMLGAGDEEHLAFAHREGRVLFTQDDGFLRLHASSAKHAGIVYARQPTAIGDMIYGLMLVAEVLDPGEMEGQIEFL